MENTSVRVSSSQTGQLRIKHPKEKITLMRGLFSHPLLCHTHRDKEYLVGVVWVKRIPKNRCAFGDVFTNFISVFLDVFFSFFVHLIPDSFCEFFAVVVDAVGQRLYIVARTTSRLLCFAPFQA